MKPAGKVLDISQLAVDIPWAGGTLNAVRGIDLSVDAGETLGIVGESGSGKTLTAMAVLGLLPPHARRSAQAIRLGDTDLMRADERAMATGVRGRRVGMIFQEPMTSLNPVYTIRRQLIEVCTLHGCLNATQAEERAIFLLEKVGLPDPRSRLSQYPHQISGGQRQRVMIAMALMNEPDLLIADEPTTALDVTIQAQILHLLSDIQREFGMAMILITHDLGVVARVADKVAVMYAGEIVETGTTRQVLSDPRHPYTRGLLDCVPDPARNASQYRLGSIPGVVPSLIGGAVGCAFAPRCSRAIGPCRSEPPPRHESEPGHTYLCFNPTPPGQAAAAAAMLPAGHEGKHSDERGGVILGAHDVSCTFNVRRGLFARPGRLQAVKDVNLELRRGEIMALVGESGCGKTTLSRIMLGAQESDGGDVLLDGESLHTLPGKTRARRIQPIFQDPYSSLNPRRTVGDTIAQPLRVHRIGDRASQKAKTEQMMELVGLPRRLLHSYPSQLSGGQRQRVAIARAVTMAPEVLICDEPTSALDVSVQAQILNLLLDLRAELGLTYLFITHSLSVVSHIADRVAVMYLGRIVELGDKETVINRPQHPYTKVLLDSVLSIAPGKGVPGTGIKGEFPNALNVPGGCPFHPRCPRADDQCRASIPPAEEQGRTTVRCFHPLGDPQCR